ncbi:hypothetical protein C1A38_18995 [Verrucosispora sp. ts21]|uniref:hypothetical protein n=1 Tax=Verrucosispora sp. ts21 TaxID=2069341 RepID=UPI000C87E18A|nr:hypothetical protein [Verrucosispora sp. ts21]PMR59548.1 hypothetical protein C1A38_18995 [Verrucosispora sp. ts21]
MSVQRPGVEVVTYDGLPAASGGAHGLRAKKPRLAWQAVQSFVDACVDPVGAPALTLRLWKGGPPDVSEPLRQFAAATLGGPRTQDRTSTAWRVRPDAVDHVLGAIEDAGVAAVTEHGHPLASLVWDAEVRLLDARTGQPYEGVSPQMCGGFAVDGYGRLLGASGVRASVGTSASSLSLWLSLPGDERLAEAARRIQAHLPVRMSAKHWRRWHLTRDGSSYRSTRIPSPLTG